MSEQSDTAPGQLVVRVGERRFALTLGQVEGVALTPPISRVPGTPPALRGLTNLHGSVVPVVDPDPTASGERRHLVVLNSRYFGRFTLACDWVEELADDSADAIPLDVDALGREVVAAFDGIDQRLPNAKAPTARLIRRSGLVED